MAEKPTAAFILSLIGAILIILNALTVFFLTAIVTRMLKTMDTFIPILARALGGMVFLMGIAGLAIGAIILVGAFMINSESKNRVSTGSIIVLVFSIISFPIGGGFIIGLILCLVGSILGLTWSPSPAPPPPPHPTSS
ncbi:MAG: hypothetical protein HA496_04650 [Thaumarchaeota archaeon]|nr:hypothetical protein [Nitrososphaerota archaeon]